MKIFFSFVVLIAVFATAIQIVISQHQSRKIFMEFQKLEIARDELNEEWEKLQIELAAWAADDRIEKIAREQLNMRDPDSNSVVLLTK